MFAIIGILTLVLSPALIPLAIEAVHAAGNWQRTRAQHQQSPTTL